MNNCLESDGYTFLSNLIHATALYSHTSLKISALKKCLKVAYLFSQKKEALLHPKSKILNKRSVVFNIFLLKITQLPYLKLKMLVYWGSDTSAISLQRRIYQPFKRQFQKMFKHTQTIVWVCLTILWDWRLKG